MIDDTMATDADQNRNQAELHERLGELLARVASLTGRLRRLETHAPFWARRPQKRATAARRTSSS